MAKSVRVFLICVSMWVGIYHVPVSMGPIELLSPGVCTQSSPSLRQPLAYLSVYLGGSPLPLPQNNPKLEYSLYKRHPSTYLQWFSLAVHLSSFSRIFLILIVSLLAFQTKHEKHWNSNDMIVFHWNAVKLMMSSCYLLHCHLLLLWQYLLLQTPGSKIIKKKKLKDILTLPVCLTLACYSKHTMPDFSWFRLRISLFKSALYRQYWEP